MADIECVCETEDQKRWLVVSRAVDKTRYGLVEYLRFGIYKMYTELLKGEPCAGLPTCTNNCSQSTTALSRNDSSTWCHTCKTWQTELLKLVKTKAQKRDINWKNISSWKWPVDVNEVVKVFAPTWWTNQQPYWKDFSVVITIILNCQVFSLPTMCCDDAKKVRNNLAHFQAVSEKDFVEYIDTLQTLIKNKEIIETENGKVAFEYIEQLKKNPKIVSDPDDPPTISRTSSHNSNQIWKFATTKAYIAVFVIIFGLIVNVQYPDNENQGCLTIEYSHHGLPELDFKIYVEEHMKTIFLGRKWLFSRMRNDLQTSERGILLAADMGYGKSAIVSHMVCANNTSPAFELKKHILYYHMCKFDVLLTQRVDIFIISLSAALIENIPSFGNNINMDKWAMHYLKPNECAADPIGCFQHLLIFPLQKIETQKVQYIVVDALDECFVDKNTQDESSLLNILANKAEALPEWLKFIFTSRNLKHVLNKFRYLHHYALNTSDARNLADIEAYLNSRQFTKSMKSTDISPSNVLKAHILSVSNGNFLFVIYALEFWVISERYSTNDFPKTLDKLLELNFKRVFGDTLEAYRLPKQIFELICTSYKPVLKSNLMKILNFTSNELIENFEKLLGNKMSHFLRMYNATVCITHKAICDFVSISNKEMSYSISKKNGHKMHAHNIFFKSTNEQVTTENVIELITHVSESSDTDLIATFQKHFKDILITDLPTDNGTLLHELSRRTNSYAAVVLLLKVLDRSSVNVTDNKGATPAFLAASNGYTDTLKAILDFGGDVQHRIYTNFKLYPNLDTIKLFKSILHLKYGLLDIAAQNGHLKTVVFLLEKHRNLTNQRNGIELNALHLAAEFGHTKVVELLLDVNKSLADHHALYLASRNGHTETVDSLLQFGINDTCLRCDGTTYWFDGNVTRLQTFYLSTLPKIKFFKLMDDERLLKCETALEAAVHFGNFDVVKLLLAKTPNALHCREYGGRTAILTAIKYNRTDIFEYLLKCGANLFDNCRHLYKINDMSHHLNTTEYNDLIRERCSNGSGVPHFIAMYGRPHMLLHVSVYLNHTRLKSFWNIRDSNNASALHYAACHNNDETLSYLINMTKSDLKETTLNGSTPYHSAVICRSILSMSYLQKYHSGGFIFVDYDGRNLMHYLSYKPFLEMTDYHYFALILSNSSENKHWCDLDSHGNSFLHYAAMYGHYQVLKCSLMKYIGDNRVVKMTEHCPGNITLTRNKKGMNVYDIAVSKLLVTPSDSIRQLKNYSFTDLFSMNRNVAPSDILSDHEHFLTYLFDVADPPELTKMPNITSLMTGIISRGNAPAILFLWDYIRFHKLAVDYEDFVLDLFHSEAHVSIINHFLIYGSFSCGKPFVESFLHRLLMNKNGKYWFCITYLKKSLLKAIAKKSVGEWDKCFDAEGYNILHRAVLGGHFSAVKFLLDSGLNIKVAPRNNKNVMLENVAMAHIINAGYNMLEVLIHDGQEIETQLLLDNETTDFDKTFALVENLIGKGSAVKPYLC